MRTRMKATLTVVAASTLAGLIAARSADEWRPLLAAADCCVTVMATLEDALRDPHFIGRGLFAHQVAYMIDRGIEPSLAAGLAGLVGLASLPGRLFFNLLSDRLPAQHHQQERHPD